MTEVTATAAPWDEMVAGGGRLRGRWHALLATLAGLGHDTLTQRAAFLDRLCVEEGVAGLLPGAPAASWRVDPVPLLLGAAEFAALEAGLAQRARLLEAVLQDVYGRQSLLASGALPPALVYANPAFLRPCRAGGDMAEGQRLHLYAAELLREPDGAWRVLADRTADAAGIGYALANRRLIARVMPELFDVDAPRRLQPFFDAWQDALQSLAPAGSSDTPFLALLTAGPSDKLWFEHVTLARTLSCTLVEGGDLTVRDGTVFLKTLRGLQRVDVLLRRMDGRALDPLELAPGPMQGVLGLLDAARSGTVRIVNDPGAGFAEAPGLAPFLPDLARTLLGEDLRLPAAPSFWLGDAGSRDAVLADLPRWCIRPALDGTTRPEAVRRLDAAAQAHLAARIAAEGETFVAFPPPPFSVAPCLGRDGLEPRPVVLRMFLVFDGTGWRALPGGLARVVEDDDLISGRLPLHARAKDVWVAAEEEDAVGLPIQPRLAVLPVRRTSGDMPSRAAENFFWLGRYLERLEGTARLLRITAARLGRPAPLPHERAELHRLAACLADAGLLAPEAAQGLAPGTVAGLLLRCVREGGPFHRLLADASRLTETLRDRLTEEVHAMVTQGLRTLRDSLRVLPAKTDGARAAEALHGLTTGYLTFCAAVAGLAAENMVRGGGRLFLDLGKRVERAAGTATMLALVLDPPGPAAQRGRIEPGRIEPGLRLALELCDCVITYRSRYLSVLQPAPALDLVLADDRNPRGLAWQLGAARDLLAELSDAADSPLATTAGTLLEQVSLIAASIAGATDQATAAADVPRDLRTVAAGIAALSDQITGRYFALLPAARHFGVAGDAGQLRGMA